MKENFPNLVKEIDVQVQEAQRVPNKMDAKRTTPRQIIYVPKVKDKERILKTAREKQKVTYKGVLIRLSADFSQETLKCFPNKIKLKEFIITKPLLHEMLKGLI